MVDYSMAVTTQEEIDEILEQVGQVYLEILLAKKAEKAKKDKKSG
jgi:hypothetical protein